MEEMRTKARERREREAAAKKAAEGGLMTDDERRRLVSTEQSLGMDTEPKMPTSIEGLETFTLSGNPADDEEKDHGDYSDADSFFKLPEGGSDADEDDDK